MSWDPTRYLQYAGERQRPALDLLARVPLDRACSIVDLGCGAGNVTTILAKRWPDAQITGVDNDEAMLVRARTGAGAPNVRYVAGDLATWHGESVPDLVFSNAALHWVGAHESLFPALASRLAPGGVLAVQMPRNFDAPSHRAVDETALSPRWRAIVGPLVRPPPVTAPEQYHRWLAGSVAQLDIWETVYLQRLAARSDGEHPVVAFVAGTWLVPYLAALGEGRKDAFVDGYRARIETAYPRQSDGSVLFPFRRLFVIALAR